MEKQVWFCEKCDQRGSVIFKIGKDSDVMSVVNLIIDDHEHVSPECTQSYCMIRVVK